MNRGAIAFSSSLDSFLSLCSAPGQLPTPGPLPMVDGECEEDERMRAAAGLVQTWMRQMKTTRARLPPSRHRRDLSGSSSCLCSPCVHPGPCPAPTRSPTPSSLSTMADELEFAEDEGCRLGVVQTWTMQIRRRRCRCDLLVDGFLIHGVDGFDPRQSRLGASSRAALLRPVGCQAGHDEQIDGVLMAGLPLLRENLASGAGGGLDDGGCGEDELIYPGFSMRRPCVEREII